jgi:hypothetical protein
MTVECRSRVFDNSERVNDLLKQTKTNKTLNTIIKTFFIRERFKCQLL